MFLVSTCGGLLLKLGFHIRVTATVAVALSLGILSAAEMQSPRVPGSNPPRCSTAGAFLQVLGSGGPMHAEGRGGSAYVLWLSGRPVIAVDMAAEAPAALVRAGAMPGTVDVLLISHLHADHVSGLSDFLWGEVTAQRRAPLVIVGPPGNDEALPSTSEFLARLIGKAGAFPVMSGLQDGNPFALRVMTLRASPSTPQHVLKHQDVAISALSVAHGATPAVAYRLDAPGFSIVFAGDQSGLNPAFTTFASDAEWLVLHTIVGDRAKDEQLAGTVGLPARFGALARAARVKHVVLSHLMGQPGAAAATSLWSLRTSKAY